jgi:FkbM family methyltransferase
MSIISLPVNNKTALLNYRDIMRNGKNIDLQTALEIFGENVYRVNDGQLNGSKVVLDIGCNLGFFSVLCAIYGASKVYAFEPNPNNLEILKQNALLNNFENVINIINKAVWNKDEKLNLLDLDRDSRIENIVELESDASKSVVSNVGNDKLPVEGIDLEKFLTDNNIAEVDICKIDVEWSEYIFIPSWSDALMKKIKYLTIEFHGVDEQTFGEMVAHLSRQFCVQTLGSHERGGYLYCTRY